MSTMTTPKPALPEPVALIDPRALARGDASLHCITRPEYRSIADADAGVEYVPVYTRAAIDAAVAEARAVPVAHVEETPAGPKLYVNGVCVRWELGCVHDAAFHELARRINSTNPSPTEPAMPADQSTIPKGWVPLRMEWEPGYPEDVAFGPQRMMDRLKKWLDKYFARVVAERNADAMPAERVALSNEQIQQHVFAVLQRHSSERLWESFTYQRGPYEITELQPAVVEICRAVIAEYERVNGITPAQGEQL